MDGMDVDFQLLLVRMRDEAAQARARMPLIDRHSPTCWKYHVPCALDRVLEELIEDQEDAGGLL